MNRWTAILAVSAMTVCAPVAAQDATGDWAGVLTVGESARLPVVVHIRRNDAGAFAGTLDSPTQGAIGLPLAEIALAGGRLSFTVPQVGGRYTGLWDAQTRSWKGEWTQGGPSLPLELTVPPPPPPLPADWIPPSDTDIRALIDQRIASRAGQGIVVGVLEPSGRRVVAGGPQGAAAFDGDTVFEIGSISKVFTALILADMANKGEVALDDPAAKYLPAGATMPSRGGRQITLADLSTHTSGLPRLADNMPFADPFDPYADYTEAMLLEFLDGHELNRDIGSQWEYSNLGVGLLGYLLGRAAGSDYATLLRERITGPLGMADTSIALSADQQARFAQGLDPYLRPTSPWTMPPMPGMGAIRSTADDMLTFAAAVLDPNSPIAAAVATTLSVRHAMGSTQAEQALGWQVAHPEPGRELLAHGGGTGGYRSQLVIEPAKGRAVIALTNSAAEPSVGDIAMRVLVGSPMGPTPPVMPPPPAAETRTEVPLPASELDRVVGRYEIAGRVFTFSREGEQLWAEPDGLPRARAYAEAPLQFFWRGIDVQIRFTTDESGTVTGGVFTQAGQDVPVRRLDP